MDTKRRKFLKLLVVGSGTLLMGQVLSPLLVKIVDTSSTKPKTRTTSKAFQVVEDKEVVSFYDSSGEEIFQIDKGT